MASRSKSKKEDNKWSKEVNYAEKEAEKEAEKAVDFDLERHKAALKKRKVNVIDFVRDRLDNIQNLVEMIDETHAVGSKKNNGRKLTALQRLPMHMRRRAMSHEIRRMPRHSRKFHPKNFEMKSKVRRKRPPQPYHRKRARQLLKLYIGRQTRSQIHWLETHIWHAKRARMDPKWGFKIAFKKAQRSHRATFRDFRHQAAIHDLSYYIPYELSCSKNHLYDSSIDAEKLIETALISLGLEGSKKNFNTSVLRHKCRRICPLEYHWAGRTSIIFWLHPAAEAEFIEMISAVFNLKREIVAMQSEDNETKSLTNYQIRRAFPKENIIYSSSDFVLKSRKFHLNRFRLIGERSLEFISRVILPVDNLNKVPLEKDNQHKDLPWARYFSRRLQKEEWRAYSTQRYGELVSTPKSTESVGEVLSLLVLDPRFTRPQSKLPREKSSLPTEPLKCTIQQPTQPFDSPLFDEHYCLAIAERKMQDKRVNLLRAKANSIDVNLLKNLASLVPVIIVLYPSNQITIVDIILPCTYAMPFWVALQYATARMCAIHDMRQLALSRLQFIYPYDWIDTNAGAVEFDFETSGKEATYKRKPPKCRPNYYLLNVPCPFKLDWYQLARSYSQSYEKVNVIDDRTVLEKIAIFIQSEPLTSDHAIRLGELVELNLSNALVPVSLLSKNGKSAPKENAMICFASTNTTDLVEQQQPNDQTKQKNVFFESDGVIQLSGAPIEFDVNIEDLFLRKQNLKLQRIKERKRQKRQRAKENKRKKKELAPSEKSISQPVEIDFKTVCRHPIIGWALRSDYSLMHGKNVAIGFVSLDAILTQNSVANPFSENILFRNRNDRFYVHGRIEILKDNE